MSHGYFWFFAEFAILEMICVRVRIVDRGKQQDVSIRSACGLVWGGQLCGVHGVNQSGAKRLRLSPAPFLTLPFKNAFAKVDTFAADQEIALVSRLG